MFCLIRQKFKTIFYEPVIKVIDPSVYFLHEWSLHILGCRIAPTLIKVACNGTRETSDGCQWLFTPKLVRYRWLQLDSRTANNGDRDSSWNWSLRGAKIVNSILLLCIRLLSRLVNHKTLFIIFICTYVYLVSLLKLYT